MSIHPTAIIDPTAEIASGVEIGPYTVIGPHCRVGEGSRLDNHVVLKEYVTLGRQCQVASGAVLGGTPQDLKFKGEESYVRLGDHAVIRECVTINRASGEQEATTVGTGCMLMAYVHLGHNCKLGDEVIVANNAQLAGYVEVGDFAFISGSCVFHQFVRVGRLAIVGGLSGTRQDIPPFAMCDGRPLQVVGINKVGLRRRGFDMNSRNRIRRAFNLLWFSELNTRQAIEAIRQELGSDAYIDELIDFVETSKRGIRRPTKGRQAATEPETADGSGELMAEIL